ncbi:putative Zinc finger, RanBP2-type [Plasmopara halstedii]
MLTKNASLSAPLDSGVHRLKARHRRREAAAPYTKHAKGNEDEKNVEFGGQETYTTNNRRGSGFLARLASYIPIVNKLVAEEDDEKESELQPTMDDSVDIQTTQEDGSDDEDEDGDGNAEIVAEAPKNDDEKRELTPESQQQKQKGSILRKEEVRESISPVTRTAPSFVTPKNYSATPPRPYSKRGSRKSRSPSRDSSVESGECSPAFIRQARKRGDKRVFLPGPSHQSKSLRITNSQHRRKSTSPSPHESALAVIKQKKTITLEEFEVLQKQLHDMVETTPQTQLAKTQAALVNGLEHPFTRGFPGPTSFPGYVPGSIARSNHGAMIVHDERKKNTDITSEKGLPFGERRRNHVTRPIVFSGSTLRGQLTREERLMRKPRPSRLLTGAKRDSAARNAYSAAIAEKVLSTLNKVQNPLEQEAQKPTPSTSLSWAKYHLALDSNDTKSLDNGLQSVNNEIAPPISTLPRVTFSQSGQKFTVMETPVKSIAKPVDSITPQFSPQTVSMTPALPVKCKSRVSKQPTTERIGNFEFTHPLCDEGSMQNDLDYEDSRVQFTFSPPPSLCEPPAKITCYKSVTKACGGAAPFNLVSSSPKVTIMERVSEASRTNEHEMPKAAVIKPIDVAKASESTTLIAPTPAASGAVNPLAKFMQLKPGQWKCPGCCVLNEASSAKCPCCETTNPNGDKALKVASLTTPNVSKSTLSSGFTFGGPAKSTLSSGLTFGGPAKSTSSSGLTFGGPAKSTLSSDITFGGPAADSKTDTAKPSDGLITAGGFSFGASSADSKKETNNSGGSITSSGFCFGFPPAGAKTEIDKSAGVTSNEFSFTAPTPAHGSGKSGGIESGLVAHGASESTIESPTLFKFSAPAKEADKALPGIPIIAKTATNAASFSFGTPSLPAMDHHSIDCTANAASSTSEAETKKGKRKASAVEEPIQNVDSSIMTSDVAKPKDVSAHRSENALISTQATSKDSERPIKRFAPISVASDSTSATSVSAFSFGSTSKPPQAPAKEATPPITFNMTSSITDAEKPKEVASSSFNFGAASSIEKTKDSKPVNTSPPKSGFTFGSISSTTAPNLSFEFGQPKSKAPDSNFGAPLARSEDVTSGINASTGVTSQVSTTSVSSSAPTFSVAPPSSSSPSFNFGTSTPASTAVTVSKAPAFTFGSSSSGQSSAISGFGSLGPAQSTAPSGFGSSSYQPAAPSNFGSTGSTPFGQIPASGFGSTSNAFGSGSSSGFGSGQSSGDLNSSSATGPTIAVAPNTPAAPAFSFGTSIQTPAPSAPAAGQPAFSFGTSSAPTGFGTTAGASGGFGFPPKGGNGGFHSTPSNFGSSSPAPAFGSQPPTKSAFGNSLPPPTGTFGGPSFGGPAVSGFGSGPSSSGYRTPSPTSAFGNASGASTFGAAPAFGATAPAFGATSTPAFGATSTPAFGATSAPAFGATSGSAFGATSAPAFGATSAPTAGAFSAPPTDGGFNMGAAPQHAKGRRILKAKTRSRRTS